jgi:hypothetical protein
MKGCGWADVLDGFGVPMMPGGKKMLAAASRAMAAV